MYLAHGFKIKLLILASTRKLLEVSCACPDCEQGVVPLSHPSPGINKPEEISSYFNFSLYLPPSPWLRHFPPNHYNIRSRLNFAREPHAVLFIYFFWDEREGIPSRLHESEGKHDCSKEREGIPSRCMHIGV